MSKEIDIDEVLITPFDRSYWVIDEKFLAGCYPGDYDLKMTEKKLTYLLRYGIRHIINLMEEDEEIHRCKNGVIYSDILPIISLKLKVNVTISRHPIPDYGITNQANIKKILDEIDENIALGKRVYVHCWGGIGRTGMIVGCYLIRHGYANSEDVLDKIKVLRSGLSNDFIESPESQAQKNIVKSWQNGM